MIKEAFAQIIEQAGLDLKRGTNLFIDFGDSHGVLVTSGAERFTLEQTNVLRELDLQVLVRDYSTTEGDALAESLLSLLSDPPRANTLDTGRDVHIVGVNARDMVSYRNQETKAREVSLNFHVTYYSL